MALPRVQTGDPGISASSVDAFVRGLAARDIDVHSLIVVREGRVAAEGWWAPYRPEYRHILYSLTKSFTSCAVGFAVQEGLVTLDEPAGAVFPEKGIKDRTLTLRHLLTMSAGHPEEPRMEDFEDWIAGFLDSPRAFEPGTHFLYSTPSTNVAAAVVERRSGMSLDAYLQPRLLGPLGIDASVWIRLKGGIVAGGYGLSITTEDIAKFGLFLLNKGSWEGRQLLDPAWIELATSKQIENGDNPDSDWNQGYCLQFWRCRHSCFRGDGAFGQFCIVIPHLSSVVAMTSGTWDLQGILDLVWSELLPGLEDGGSGPVALEGLSLSLPPASGAPRTLPAASYDLEPCALKLSRMTLESSEAEAVLTLVGEAGTRVIRAGYDRWTESQPVPYERFGMGEPRLGPCLARAAWQDESTLVIRAAEAETPTAPIYTIKLAGEGCELAVTRDLSFFHESDWPVVKGTKAQS